MNDWNSKQYLKYKRERTQPSLDLISRIKDISPKNILDVGCGSGNSTAELLNVFPKARILGIDSSDDMLNRAKDEHPELTFLKGTVPDDLEKIEEKFDLIFSNACIQWIPKQRLVIKTLVEKLNQGGTLAVQIPLIQEAPFYKLLEKLKMSEKYEELSEIKNFHNLLPEEYYDLFSSENYDFDMWQTSYYHIVAGISDIIEWYKGSGLRPYLEALVPSKREELICDLTQNLPKYYKIQADKNVIMKMPRLFFVIKKS